MIQRANLYIELTKPRITLFCVIMACGGFFMAPNHTSLPFLKIILLLLGVAASVGAANSFNMIWERHVDKKMTRTASRPLPSNKIKVSNAFLFAIFLAIVSLVSLFFVNTISMILALFAICAYVLIYTPLKQKTPLALVIGAVPGAIPILLGWVSSEGTLSFAALSVFLILFLWQMPHFIAISLYSQEDYRKAGIKVLPLIRGNKVAIWQAIVWTICLVLSPLLLYWFQVSGLVFVVLSLILGGIFFLKSCEGLITKDVRAWSKKFFLLSLVYLLGLVFVYLIDMWFRILK